MNKADKEKLIDRVMMKIGDITVTNPGYIAVVVQETLRMTTSDELLRKIAKTAVNEIDEAMSELL